MGMGKNTLGFSWTRASYLLKGKVLTLVLSVGAACFADTSDSQGERMMDNQLTNQLNAVRHFDIDAQGIPAALLKFGEQAELTVMVHQDASGNTPGLQGEYRIGEALQQLLADTGLEYRIRGEAIIVTRRVAKLAPYLTKPKLSTRKTIGAVLASFFLVSASNGQEIDADSGAAGLEEIVVTATKREKSLQDVPMSISALTTADITRQGIETVDNFAAQIPGISMHQGTKTSNSNLSVRGINIAAVIPGTGQQAAAIYYDDVPVTSAGPMIPDPRLFDVERIEVLRGPQGTLFGSGTLSGAVRIITNKPDLNGFDALGSVDLGTTDSDSLRQRYNGMVNVPLIDGKLALRAVGYVRDEEGYVDNIATGIDNANGQEDWGGRISLKWAPNDRFTASVMVLHEDAESQDVTHSREEGPCIEPVPGETDTCAGQASLGKYTKSTFLPDVTAIELTNYNLALEYDFDWATLTSSTTYSDMISDWGYIIDGVLQPMPFIAAAQRDVSTLVQEVRLVSTTDSDFEWIVGAWYFDRTKDQVDGLLTTQEFLDAENITGLPEGFGLGFGNAAIAASNVLTILDERELAIFGELSWDITDNVTLTGGLRFTDFETTLSNPGTGFDSFGALLDTWFAGGNAAVPLNPVTPFSVSSDDSQVTSKISLTWRRNETQTYYVLASEGYRNLVMNLNAGQVSVVDPSDLVPRATAAADSLWNYEIGVKATWFDGRLKTNVAAFYIPWKDVQLQVQRVSDGLVWRDNAGDVTSKGIELELQALPTEALELGLNVTLQDAKVTSITDIESAATGATKGQRMTSPDVQVAAYAQYTWLTGKDDEMYARIDAQHVGSYPNGFAFIEGQPGVPDPQVMDIGGYENVNGSIGWVSNKCTVAVYGENLLDHDDAIFSFPAPILNRFTYLRPRTFGIRVSRQF